MTGWKKESPRPKSWVYICTKCNGRVYWIGVECKYRYCPWCMAEMARRDGYHGTTHEQGWPNQRVQTLHGGGEVHFDMPPGKYPLVCESTRKDERSD